MTRVLAAVDDSPTREPVRRIAAALAAVLGAEVDVVTVVEAEEPVVDATVRRTAGPAIERLTAELSAPDVLLGVLGARGLPGGRRATGHVVSAIIESAPCPIVVVPPGGEGRLRRILVPVEGDDGPPEPLSRILSACAGGGVGIVSLHVFTAETTPAFWEGWNDLDLWRVEFGARHAPAGTTIELRSGDVCTEVCGAAAELETDLVAVTWHQDLSPGRARVVRALLDRSVSPVLLIPAPHAA